MIHIAFFLIENCLLIVYIHARSSHICKIMFVETRTE